MVTIWYHGVYIKVPQYCRLMDLFYCHTIALLRSDRTNEYSMAWVACCLMFVLMFPQAVFSSVFYFASVPLYQGFLIIGWVCECWWLICTCWNLAGISAMCFSDSSDIWGSLRVLFHRESRPLSSKKSIRADAHQKTLCEVWNEQGVKADRLRSRLIQGKWWNSPSRQSRTERGTRWNFTHTSTDVNLDLSRWLSLHIKYRLVTCTSQQNVKHFTTFGAFYFYSLINVRVKDVFYYWLKNYFPVLEKLWKISEKHEKFHSLYIYIFIFMLCFKIYLIG